MPRPATVILLASMAKALEHDGKVFICDVGLQGQLTEALPVLCLALRAAADQARRGGRSEVEDKPGKDVVGQEAIAGDGVDQGNNPGTRTVSCKQASKQASKQANQDEAWQWSLGASRREAGMSGTLASRECRGRAAAPAC